MVLQDGSVWRRVVNITFGWTPDLHSCLAVNSCSSPRTLAAAYAATSSDATWLWVALSTVRVNETPDSFRRSIAWKGQKFERCYYCGNPVLLFVFTTMYTENDNMFYRYTLSVPNGPRSSSFDFVAFCWCMSMKPFQWYIKRRESRTTQ